MHEGSQALGRLQPFSSVHSAADSRTYLSSLGLFGTAGDPNETYNWRAEVIPTILNGLEMNGLREKVTVFNPQKENWSPEDAVVEAEHLARDAALILPVLDVTTGHASLAETGFAALSGTLRPQKVNMFIESGHEFGDVVQRARTLTTLLATKTLHDFPINIRLAHDLQSMVAAGISDVSNFTNNIMSRVNQEFRYTVERRTDLAARIALVGSGAAHYADSWYEGVNYRLQNNDVRESEIYSAYVNNWSVDDALRELEHKTNDAVILFAVTKDQDSYGAMGELGWLLTYCVLNGQKLGVYVEPHQSEPKSDQNRQRKLAMTHMGRHLLDFPDLPVFIAKSPAELVLFGASELAKYKQLQLASNTARASWQQ